ADALARRVVEPGQPAFDDIVAEYGRDVLLPDGAIDRKKLADIVFGDDARRRRLNAITHPRIAAASRAELAAHAAACTNGIIYEAALLVENGIHRTLDGLIVVACSPEEQLRRLMARDGLDEAAARARIAAQLPLAEKLAAATFVVDTSGPFDDTRRQVERVWRTLAGNPP